MSETENTPAPLTESQLSEIEARANAASRGPWTDSFAGVQDAARNYVVDIDEWKRPEDAEFIAHARTDVPALVNEVRRLRSLVDRYVAFLGGDIGHHDLHELERFISRADLSGHRRTTLPSGRRENERARVTDLYRVPAFCPDCLRRAACRAYLGQVMAARGMDRETPLLSLPCLNRECETLYFPVLAYDFARAVKERRAA